MVAFQGGLMKKSLILLTGIIAAVLVFVFAESAHAVKREKISNPEENSEPVSQPVSTGRPLSVAIYKVTTNGFSLNGSEVREINRLAMQACYDAGLKCSGRNETASNVQNEQGYGGRGKIAQSEYIAEFTLTGSTEDAVKLGLPGGLHIGGAYGRSIGGAWVGGGTYTDLSGLGIKLSSMTLTGQVTDSSDGSLAYSGTKNKIGLKGSFIVGETTSSNAKKLLSTFREMFEDFKKRNQ